MNIQHLREFIYLAEHLNYSSTAYHFFISQSTLTKHIFNLEKETGCSLFTRNTQSVRITPYGKMLYDDAIGIVSQYDHAIDHIRNQLRKDSEICELQIGYSHLWETNFITTGIGKFKKKFPQVDILHRVYHESDEIYNAVKYGNIDIAFTLPSDRISDKKFKYVNLFKNYFKVLVSPGHRLANRSSITLSELEGEVCIIPNDNFSIYLQKIIASIFKAMHVNISFLSRPISAESCILLAQQGKGVCIVLQCFAVNPSFSVRSILVNCDSNMNTIAVWKRQKHNKLIDAFIESVQEVSSTSDMIQL